MITDSEILDLLKIKPTDRVLDVGGSMKQHKDIAIDTLADIIRPEESPYFPEKLKAKKFVRTDFTKDKLPFKDKEFDVCLCTHTLEDLFDPFILMEEIQRVAKRGIIVTPSFGEDIIFSKYNLTDWLTGARRVPGVGHHKWLFIKSGNMMVVIPKNYPILYSSDFHYTNWSGDKEFVYVWNNIIRYERKSDLDFHKLISIYRSFVNKNKTHLKKGLPLMYFDNPFVILKQIAKLIFKKGEAFSHKG